jgi:hypothetical protein
MNSQLLDPTHPPTAADLAEFMLAHLPVKEAVAVVDHTERFIRGERQSIFPKQEKANPFDETTF